MKRLFLVVITQIIAIHAFAQKDSKFYKEGLEYFDKGEYKKADSLFTISLKNTGKYYYADLSQHYINRGFSRLNLYDTLGFCLDMKEAVDKYNNFNAKSIYKGYCLSYNKNANRSFEKAKKEFDRSNFRRADSLLEISTGYYEFVDNVLLQGIIRLYMTDTINFCLKMDKIYPYDERAIYNFRNFCTDTIYLDVNNNIVRKKTPYYEVFYRENNGISFDETNKEGSEPRVIFNNAARVNKYSIATIHYLDTIKSYSNIRFYPKGEYSSELTKYINKKIQIPKGIVQVLQNANIEMISIPFNCIISEKGEFLACKCDYSKNIIDEKEKLNTVFMLMNDMATESPREIRKAGKEVDNLYNEEITVINNEMISETDKLIKTFEELILDLGKSGPKQTPLIIRNKPVKTLYKIRLKVKV